MVQIGSSMSTAERSPFRQSNLPSYGLSQNDRSMQLLVETREALLLLNNIHTQTHQVEHPVSRQHCPTSCPSRFAATGGSEARRSNRLPDIRRATSSGRPNQSLGTLGWRGSYLGCGDVVWQAVTAPCGRAMARLGETDHGESQRMA